MTIQHENNLKSLPNTAPIIKTVTSFQQGLTASIFTIAANNDRVKLSVQNLGINPINILINNQTVSIIYTDICQFIPDTECRLSIGLSSTLGSNALITSYLIF